MNPIPDRHESYDFIQLLRILEQNFARSESDGGAMPLASKHMADKERIRLRASYGLGFAPRAVARDPRRSANGDQDKAEIFADIDALAGFAGVLPRHIADDIQQQLQEEGRSSIAEFLDVFYHRLLSFYYRSFCHSHLGLETEQMRLQSQQFAKPAIATIIQQLAHRPPGASFDDITGSFALLLHKGGTSVDDLERIISALTGKTVTVKAFHGKWFGIKTQELARIGSPQTVLGRGSVLGAKVFSVHNILKVTIASITVADISEYVAGTIIGTIRKLIVELTGIPFQVDISLGLLFENHRMSLLGENRTFGSASSLGIGAVLGSRGDDDTFTFRRTRNLTIDLQTI